MGENNSETGKSLSKEQEDFLELLEAEFKDRYTEADPEFKSVWENDLPPPPIFVDWEVKNERRSTYNNRRNYKDYHIRDFRQKRYSAYDRPGRRTY